MLMHRKILIVVCAVTLTISSAGCGKPAANAPTIQRPVVKMPSPNAYDYFVEAGKLLKNAGALEQATSSDSGVIYSIAQKARLVERNQAALKKLRQGLHCRYQQPFKYGIEAEYPEYRLYRGLARLLLLEAEVRSARGGWAGSFDSCQDAMAMGQIVCHGDANWMGRGVCIYSQNVVRPILYRCIAHLDVTQTRRATARMRDLERLHVPVQETLRLERDYCLFWLKEAFAGRCTSPETKEWPRLPDYIKTQVLNRYAQFQDQCIANVSAPYVSKPVFPEIKQSKNPAVAFRNAPADIILSVVCMSPERLWYRDVLGQTQNRLLTTALALQAYHCDHSQYPAKLDDLTPKYLPKVPTDLFALKGRLKYQREGAKYVLWSVGPDGVDDGGKPATDPKAQTGALPLDRYRVVAESMGDIVAGVNL